MKKLHLAHGLALPVDAVTQTFAILAMRGVGKTYTASVLAEEFSKAELPFAVLDPTGAWYGLRSSADGKSEGFPVTILGGDHADAPLEETAGKVIADLLAEEAPPLILDMSLLSKSAMRRFVADFAERLYEKNRNPLHVIIDEADAFAPQKPRSDELRMLGAIDEIVRRGRIRGLGCTLVTQRSSVLNKDVLTQTEILVALRTAHPRDRAPILEWMKVHATDEQLAAVEDSLAKLPKGDAWVMSAGWLDLFKRIHIRKRLTFNSSATPEAGQRRIEPRKLAPVDLDVLRKKMAETIERAKAQDPRELQKRIRELEAELKKAREAKEPRAKIEIREVYVLKEGQLKRIEKIVEKALVAGAELDSAAKELRAAITPAMQPAPQGYAVGDRVRVSGETRMATHVGTARPAEPPRPPALRPIVTHGDGEVKMNRGAREMLRALAGFNGRGLTRQEIGVHAVLGYQTGTFSDYLSAMRRAGFIVEDGNRIGPTVEGLAAAGGPQTPRRSDELVSEWLRTKIGGGAARMLQALWHHRAPMTRAELGHAAQLGHETGTFSDYLSLLRRNGLLDEPNRGEVAASAALFLGDA